MTASLPDPHVDRTGAAVEDYFVIPLDVLRSITEVAVNAADQQVTVEGRSREYCFQLYNRGRTTYEVKIRKYRP